MPASYIGTRKLSRVCGWLSVQSEMMQNGSLGSAKVSRQDAIMGANTC